METKKTLFNPLIIVIAVAVMFAIGVDIYVFCNIKKIPAPKPYYAKTTKVTYSTTKTSRSTDSTGNKIVTDESTSSTWKTFSGKAFGSSMVTFKYPAGWTVIVSATSDNIYLKKTDNTVASETGAYDIEISKLGNNDDSGVIAHFGKGQATMIGDYSATSLYNIGSDGVPSYVYVVTIGDNKYLSIVKFLVPSDTVGAQIISTLRIQ